MVIGDTRSYVRALLAFAALAPLLFASGCSIYLHDDTVQKQTADALKSYTTADVPEAISAVVKSQSALDRKQVDAAIALAEAERQKDIMLLLVGKDNSSAASAAQPSTIHQRLSAKVDARIVALVGHHELSDGTLAKLVMLPSVIDTAQRQLNQARDSVGLKATDYAAAGGKDFVSCGTFKAPSRGPQPLMQAGIALDLACVTQERTHTGLNLALALLTKPGCNGTEGILESVCQQLADAQVRVQADNAAAAAITKQLEAAKTAYKKATKNSTDLNATVTAALAKLQSDIAKADHAVSAAGGVRYKPGAALAAIRFRKTNICDVIAASAKTTCSGTGAPSQSATSVETAMAGIIAGVGDFTHPLPASNPSALQIALAYQTGLQSGAQASLSGLAERVSLLQAREQTMEYELILLVRARAGLARYARAPPRSSTARDALAAALIDYNRSWIEGRIPEGVDKSKLEQEGRDTDLRVAQANAVAWDGALNAALSQLAAFGQGGIAPQTIADFLKVAGITAIAKGVN